VFWHVHKEKLRKCTDFPYLSPPVTARGLLISFYETLYCAVLLKFVSTFQFWLQYDKGQTCVSTGTLRINSKNY